MIDSRTSDAGPEERWIAEAYRRHGWTEFYAGRMVGREDQRRGRSIYTSDVRDELDRMVAAGKLRHEVRISCPLDHTTWVGAPDDAERAAGACRCSVCEASGGHKEDQFVITESWARDLGRNA